jgi:hypothetical protein
MTLIITTLYIMTFDAKTLSIITHLIMTFSITLNAVWCYSDCCF